MVDDSDGFGREGDPLVLLRQLWVNFGTFCGGGKRWIWKGGSSDGAAIKVPTRDSSALLLSAASFKLSSCSDWFWWAPFYKVTFRYLVIFGGETVNTLQKLGILELCTPGDRLVDHAQLGQVHPAGADLPPASPLLKPSLTTRRRSQVLILKKKQ